MDCPPTKKAKTVKKERPTAWDQVHTITLSNGIPVHIAPEEAMLKGAIDPSSPSNTGWTGGSVWEAAKVLANLLSEEPDRVRGKRVLELGSGCGLLGMVAGALGAREVTLTDEVLFMVAKNLDANFIEEPRMRERFKLQELSWGNKDHITAAGPPYDVILCSDVLYDGTHHKNLALTIIGLARPGTCVLLATPDGMPGDRSYFCRVFYSRLREDGNFQLFELPSDRLQNQEARIVSDCGGGYDRGIIRVVEMHMSDAPLSD